MSEEWVGIIHSTMPKYMKGASDLTMRRRLLLARLRQKGRIEYNASGDECRWQVEFSQPAVEAYADGGVLDFANHDAFRQCILDWRGYTARDAISEKQRQMNKGAQALINLFQTKQSRLMKSLDNNFAGEFFVDGNAAGNESRVHGVGSFTGAGTVAAGDIIAQPSDTYAGLSTALANEGGSWADTLTTQPNSTISTDWPYGNGDTEYDFFSPKLTNFSSTAWGTSSATDWETNCLRAIGTTITWLTHTGGEDGMPDICLLSSNLFQQYKQKQLASQRIIVPHKGAQDLGFENVLNQDGCMITSDFDVAANTGYMLNTSTIGVRSLMPELFWQKGPTEDIRTLSYLWAVGFFGNLYFQPKYVGKLYAAA